MHDYSVRNLQVQDIQSLDQTNQPITTKRVTFYVGTSGPFYLSYRPADYTADRVQADVQREVETLKAIAAGLTPAP